MGMLSVNVVAIGNSTKVGLSHSIIPCERPKSKYLGRRVTLVCLKKLFKLGSLKMALLCNKTDTQAFELLDFGNAPKTNSY